MNDDDGSARHDWPLAVSTYRADAGLRGIVQGMGCVRAEMGAQLRAQGVRRPLLVCGAFVRETAAFSIVHDAIAAATGTPPLVFAGSAPHSPSSAIEEAAGLARDHGVDGIVAVGGSSSIDSAKGMAVLLGTGVTQVTSLVPPAPGGLATPHDTARGAPAAAATQVPLPVPVLTATTTLSYAEFFPFWGTRRADTGAKAGYGDHGVVQRTIFLDGELAACTPDRIWFETAIKSFDDALLVFLRSGGAEPFLDPLLLDGLRTLVRALPSSGSGGSGAADPALRQHVLTAMALTKLPVPRTQPGFAPAWFARAVRYALGSLYDASHGVGTCIAMTAGLRFHAAGTAARQDALADALGLRTAQSSARATGTDLLVACFDELVTTFDLPRSLDDIGVVDEQVDQIVGYIVDTMPDLGARPAVEAAVAALRAPARPVGSRP